MPICLHKDETNFPSLNGSKTGKSCKNVIKLSTSTEYHLNRFSSCPKHHLLSGIKKTALEDYLKCVVEENLHLHGYVCEE